MQRRYYNNRTCGQAESSKVTVAVATVVIFGTLAIFLYCPAMYPLVAPGLARKPMAYISSTMHEVAQVVAEVMPLTGSRKRRGDC